MPGGKIDVLVEPDLRGFPSKLQSGLRGASNIASTIGKGLGLAVAGGTAVAAVGLKNIIQLGNEYTANLNELQAVSGATAEQMAKVGDRAKDLGSDLTLPATSAADAAAAMVELAKGGLSVDEAMAAAKGTLQLAAAAQVDGATAAELQSSALNAFGLSASKAGLVADVLANTANAAAGSMIDIGNSLKYVAPVSAALGVSIENTAAAIGLLANQGIKGEQAGTSLRGILASLASPSAAAAEAMETLGLKVFDAQGKFVGLRVFTDQLAQAKKRLTDADFAAASSTAFGNEGFTAANALAAEGATAFDQMAAAVGRSGGAAEVAAAKTKGLGGAWEGFQSQLETAAIEIYEVIAPPLENAVRAGASFVERFTPTVINGIRSAVAVGATVGPGLASAIKNGASDLLDAGRELVEPLIDGLIDSLNSAYNVGLTVFGGFAAVVGEAVDAIDPLVVGVGDFLEGINQTSGPVSALITGLELIYGATAGLIRVVSPAVEVVGDLVSMFAGLPGPVQSAAIAMLALRFGPSLLGGLRSALRGTADEAGSAGRQTGLFGRAMSTALAPVRAAASGISGTVGVIRQFNDEARLQQTLARGAGEEVGRFGGAVAAFNTSALPGIAAARGFRDQTVAIREGAAGAGQPISAMGAAISTVVERSAGLSAMRSAFDQASAGATRFGRTAGAAAAAGVALRGAGTGLVSVLGGPWGIALAGASLGLSLLADRQEKAKQEAQNHQAAVDGLAGALRDARDSGEDVGRALRENIAEALTSEFADASRSATEFGFSVRQITDAVVKGGPTLENMKRQLAEIAMEDPLSEQGQRAGQLINVIAQLEGRYAGAREQNKQLALATDEGAESMFDAAGAGGEFADSMKVLADNTSTADDKARALKDALDVLAGGHINLEQAQSAVNEQLDELAAKFGENLDKTKGWGRELLNADGSIKSTTDNGRYLLDTLDSLSASTADVAQKTFDAAVKAGDDFPTALAKARKAAQGVRDSLVDQAEQLGLTTEEVQALADRYGIVPEDVVTLIQTPGMTQAQIDMVVLKNKIGDVPPGKTVTVTGLTEAAVKKLQDIGFRVTHLPDGSFRVSANTKTANDVLAGLARKWNGYTIYLNTAIRGRNNQIAQLGGGLAGAVGGIVETYAQGGVRKLTPLDGRIAHRVPANTWRVIGDRPRGLEYYLPDDDKPRTMEIGAEWARRRGLVLVRKYAEGGINVPETPAPPVGPRVSRGGGSSAVMPVGVNVEQLNIRAYSDRFSLKQVQDNLAAYGIS